MNKWINIKNDMRTQLRNIAYSTDSKYMCNLNLVKAEAERCGYTELANFVYSHKAETYDFIIHNCI